MTRNAECDNRRQMYFFFSTIACVCGRWPSGTVGSGTDLRELSFGFSLPIANENGCLSSGERAVRREICISSPENPAATCGKPFWHDNVVPQVAASFFGATMSPRKLRQAISVRICHPATCGGKFRVRDAVCPMGNLHFHGRDADSPPNNGISAAETIVRISPFCAFGRIHTRTNPKRPFGRPFGVRVYARFLQLQEDSLSPFLLAEPYL